MNSETQIKMFALELEDFLETDLGKFIMHRIDGYIESETSQADRITDLPHTSQRHFDRAAGARGAKQAITNVKALYEALLEQKSPQES